jgi:hypothetical protein
VMKPRDFQPLHDDGRSRTRTWDLFLIRGAQAVVLAGTWSNLQANQGIVPVLQAADGTDLLGSGFHTASMPRFDCARGDPQLSPAQGRAETPAPASR